jgi:hypothetical protein
MAERDYQALGEFTHKLVSAVTDLVDLTRSRGAHEGHTLRQVGRCVYCSCGERFQGRLRGPRVAADRAPVFEVVLADGFVSYRGSEDEAEKRAAKHAGASVRLVS